MHDGTVLDLGMEPQFATPASARRISPRLIWVLAVVAALAIGALQVVSGSGLGGVMKALGFNTAAQAEATIRVSLEAKRAVASFTEGAQATIVVQGDAAKERNALITDLLSRFVIEATGPLMFRESSAPAGPVLWLNHDIIARQLTQLHA